MVFTLVTPNIVFEPFSFLLSIILRSKRRSNVNYFSEICFALFSKSYLTHVIDIISSIFLVSPVLNLPLTMVIREVFVTKG
jgi:hypothetical protein